MQLLKSSALVPALMLLVLQQRVAARPAALQIAKPSDPCADADAINNLNKWDDDRIRKQMIESGKNDILYSSVRISQYKQFLLTWITPFGYHLEYDKSGKYSIITHAWNIAQPKSDLILEVGGSPYALKLIRQYTGYRKDTALTMTTRYDYTYTDSYNVYALEKSVFDAITNLSAASYFKSVSKFPVINRTIVPSGSCPLYLFPREFQILRNVIDAKPGK